MVDFERVQGRILVGQSAEEDERINDDKNLYSSVLFDLGSFALRFYSGIGGYYKLSAEHINGTDGDVYYPYQNETTVEPVFGSETSEFNVFAEGVEIEYALVENDMYVRSQNEITAYGGTHLVHNGSIYKIVNSLFSKPDGKSETDELLDINSAVENPVEIQNVETGYSAPRSYDYISSIVEEGRFNGALLVGEPESGIIKRML